MSNQFQSNEGFIVCEEFTSSTPSILAEENKSVIFEAVLQEADAPNRNKRIYGKDVLSEALNSPTIQEKLRNKTFYGKISLALHYSNIVSNSLELLENLKA